MAQPAGDDREHLQDLAAAICASGACPVDHGPGTYCFRGWDGARAVAALTAPAATAP